MESVLSAGPDMPLWVKPGSLATINALGPTAKKSLNLNGPI